MAEKTVLKRLYDLYARAAACDAYFSLRWANCEGENLDNVACWIVDCASEERQALFEKWLDDESISGAQYTVELQRETTQLFNDMKQICEELMKDPTPFEDVEVALLLTIIVSKMTLTDVFY